MQPLSEPEPEPGVISYYTKTLIEIFSEIVFENRKWGTSYQTPKKLLDGERKYHAASIKGRKI